MNGEIAAIYRASAAGVPMQSISVAKLESGEGIVGDRYHLQAGTFSGKLKQGGLDDWHVTLIEAEEIDEFAKSAEIELEYGDLRRNIVTRNVRLNALVGQQFRIGDVLLMGIRLCEPCAYLATLVSPRVLPELVGRAGLRASIITGGSISPGDGIEASTL